MVAFLAYHPKHGTFFMCKMRLCNVLISLCAQCFGVIASSRGPGAA